MNLQTLQINLLNLVKSRAGAGSLEDPYLRKVAACDNLALARKIIFWWRRLQVQNYCALTTTLLRSYGVLDDEVLRFSNGQFSVFREEVGLEFIDFINVHSSSPLVKSVSSFEKALIRLKTGYTVAETIPWPCEPFSAIQALLDDNFIEAELQPGNYVVEVSNDFGDELFRVY